MALAYLRDAFGDMIPAIAPFRTGRKEKNAPGPRNDGQRYQQPADFELRAAVRRRRVPGRGGAAERRVRGRGAHEARGRVAPPGARRLPLRDRSHGITMGSIVRPRHQGDRPRNPAWSRGRPGRAEIPSHPGRRGDRGRGQVPGRLRNRDGRPGRRCVPQQDACFPGAGIAPGKRVSRSWCRRDIPPTTNRSPWGRSPTRSPRS